jgi:hypothetical protein
VARDEGTGSQIEHQAAIHFSVEVEVEVIESFVRVAELGLFFSSLQQSLATTSEFVGDEAGEEVDGGHGFGLSLVKPVSSTAAIPPSRSCPKARFNSMRFIFWLLGSEVDEIAAVDQFTNERIDLPQGELWGAFEIATNEAVLMHSYFESSRRGILDRGGTELLGQREHAQDATNAAFSELRINKVAKRTGVRAGASGSPQ